MANQLTSLLKKGKVNKATLDVLFAKIETGEAVLLPTYTVAAVPAAASYTGRLIRVSNGDAGSPCLALSNGTNWLRITLGAAVAAS